MLNDLHISVQTLIDRNNIAVHRESSYPANRFCHCLERIFVYGLKKTWLGNTPSFFEFITVSSIESDDLRLRHATNKAKSIADLHNDGKGRAFFRQALNEKQLPIYISELVKNTDFVKTWYHPWCVLGNNRQLETMKATLEDLDLVKSEFKMLLNDKKVNILTLWEFSADDIPEWSDDAERGAKKRKETVIADCPEDEIIQSLPRGSIVSPTHGVKKKKKKKKRKRKNIQIVQSDDPSLYAHHESEAEKKKKKEKEKLKKQKEEKEKAKRKKAAREVKSEPILVSPEPKRERVEISTGAVDANALASQIPDTFIEPQTKDNPANINNKIIMEDIEDDVDFVPTIDENDEDLLKLASSKQAAPVTLASIFQDKPVEKTSHLYRDQLNEGDNLPSALSSNTNHNATNDFYEEDLLEDEQDNNFKKAATTSQAQNRNIVPPFVPPDSFSKTTTSPAFVKTNDSIPQNDPSVDMFARATTSPGKRRGAMSSQIYTETPINSFQKHQTNPFNNENTKTKKNKVASLPIERPINYNKHKTLTLPPPKSEMKSPRIGKGPAWYTNLDHSFRNEINTILIPYERACEELEERLMKHVGVGRSEVDELLSWWFSGEFDYEVTPRSAVGSPTPQMPMSQKFKQTSSENLSEEIPAEKIDLPIPVVFIPNRSNTPSRSSSIEPMEFSPEATSPDPSSSTHLYHNNNNSIQNHERKKDPAMVVISSETTHNYNSSSSAHTTSINLNTNINNNLPIEAQNATKKFNNFNRERNSTEKFDDDFNEFDDWYDSDEPSEEPVKKPQPISFPGQAVRATLRAKKTKGNGNCGLS